MDDAKRWCRHYAEVLEKWHAGRAGPQPGSNKRATGLFEFIALALAAGAALWAASQASGWSGLGDRLRSGHLFADSITDGEEWDYIVVGAGAAGSAAAARLALGGSRVLLLEAGGDAGLVSKMPGATLALSGSAVDWHYDTLSNNKSCLGNVDNMCPFIRGRCVGGSSAVNFMMYSRGNRQDYDYNLTGWTWEHFEPYFLRYEGLYDSHRLPKSSARYHNTSGIIPIGYFGDSGNPWHERIIEALEYLDIPYNPDVNAKSQIGVSQVLGFVAGGERVNIAKAYLEQEGVKKTLKLVKNARCTGVIIGEDNVARGVSVFIEPNTTLHLYAKHEVVLSAGAVATPQLLMLSGVGPAEHLKEFGIPVRADLPVGEGMSDHVLPVVYVQVDDEYKSDSLLSTIGSKGFQAAQWLATRSGPMASLGLTDVTAFINTECYNFTQRRLLHDRPECDLPNLQLFHAFADKGLVGLMRSVVQTTLSQRDEVFDEIFAHNEERSLVVLSPALLQPASRGRVRLASADPRAPPAVAPNYLGDARDLRGLVRALRLLEHAVRAPPYRRHNASLVRLRACGGAAYWACYARRMSQSGHHAVGTAALGRVLDARLRVRAVRRLRVADASALPRLPRGNPAAAVVALGERVADFITEDRRLQESLQKIDERMKI